MKDATAGKSVIISYYSLVCCRIHCTYVYELLNPCFINCFTVLFLQVLFTSSIVMIENKSETIKQRVNKSANKLQSQVWNLQFTCCSVKFGYHSNHYILLYRMLTQEARWLYRQTLSILLYMSSNTVRKMSPSGIHSLITHNYKCFCCSDPSLPNRTRCRSFYSLTAQLQTSVREFPRVIGRAPSPQDWGSGDLDSAPIFAIDSLCDLDEATYPHCTFADKGNEAYHSYTPLECILRPMDKKY